MSPVKGLLAGAVLDKFARPVSKASIQLVEVREGAPSAPLEVLADERGLFTIPGLDPSAAYQLTARVQDGERLMAGSAYARPPNGRMVIVISEDYVTPATPKPPPMPAVQVPMPGPPRTPDEKKHEKPAEERKPGPNPGATIAPPVVPKVDLPPPPPPGPAPAPALPSGGDTPSSRNPRPDLRIRVPTLSIPSGPGRESDPAPVLPPVPLAPASYTSQPLPVPSCIMLTPRQLDNFALQDVDGKPWEFRRDRKGRLVLLDFWFSACPPCRKAIEHLKELHQGYASRGLEVIGIACEQQGSPGAVLTSDEVVTRVLRIKSRQNIPYRLLLAGDQGPLRPCPVSTQLGIVAFPTLKLIDENGKIVREWVGLDDRQLYELKMEIEKRLPLMR
jgi:thiol-disulfide isomerase/thioredoxin